MIHREDYPQDPEIKSRLLEELSTYLTEERSELFDRILDSRTRFLTVVTEDLYQEHNVSAILRTCDCFGVQDLYSIQKRNEFVHTEKISRGAEKWVDLIEFNGTSDPSMECMDMLRNKGYSIVATSPHGDGIDLNELKVESPMALFFGSEKPGLTNAVLDNADYKLRIPMYGFTESFNVSVAVALILNKMVSEMRKLDESIWSLSSDEKKDIKLLWTLRSIKSPEFILRRHLEAMI